MNQTHRHHDLTLTPPRPSSLLYEPLSRVNRRYKNPRTGRCISRDTLNKWRRILGLTVQRRGNQHCDGSWIDVESIALLDAWYYLTQTGYGMSPAEFIDRFLDYDPEVTPLDRITQYLNEQNHAHQPSSEPTESPVRDD